MLFFNLNHSSSAASPGSGMPQLRWEERGVTPGRAQHPKRVLRRQTQEEFNPGCAGKQEPQLKSARCIYCNAAFTATLQIPLHLSCLCPIPAAVSGLAGAQGDWDAHTHQSCQHFCKAVLLMLNVCCTHSATKICKALHRCQAEPGKCKPDTPIPPEALPLRL